MGIFSFLGGKRKKKDEFHYRTAAHEIRNDVLHWKVGDSLVKPHGTRGPNRVPSSSFYIFKGFPSPTRIAVIKASPHPNGNFIEKHGARVETKECYSFLPGVKNYSNIARNNAEREKAVIESTKSSSYQRFIEEFQRAYKEEVQQQDS